MTRLIFLITLSAVIRLKAANLEPTRLQADGSRDPQGVDLLQPIISWQSKARNGLNDQKQTSYQILVASSRELLVPDKADLWDTGKIVSDDSTTIHYGGTALASSQRVFWSVRIWDDKDQPSDWSPAATWTMGILSAQDWKANWIGSNKEDAAAISPTLLLRKEFTVKSGLTRAVIHLCGLGQYNLSFNGTCASPDLLSPGWTNTAKTCLYDTHEVTALLKSGANAIGIELAGGMYRVTGNRYTKFKNNNGPLQAIALLRLEYKDGSMEIVPTDSSWQMHAGPATFSCIYGGMDFDARLAQAKWDYSGFKSTGWSAAEILKGPAGTLHGHSFSAPPLRAIESLKCVSSTQPAPDSIVYDFGQNAPILPKVTFQGSPGSTIRLIPSELLGKTGHVDRASCSPGNRPAYWQYTFGSDKQITWQPNLWYHGARYLEAQLIPAEDGKLPKIDQIEAIVVHSSAEPAGNFECSNLLFNRIHSLIRWSQRANLVSIITDCPHRERLGWLEQYHLHGPSLRYEWSMDRLWTKTLRDMADSQTPEGLVPNIAPEFINFKGRFRDSPEWGSSFVIVPWQHYEWTGDTSILNQHFENMKRYVAYLESRSKDSIVSHGLGDWYDIGPNKPGVAQLTPIALTATAYYYHTADIVAKSAALLGRSDDAEKYAALAANIRRAFNEKFFDPIKGSYSTGSQTSNAIPLVFHIVPENRRQDVLSALVLDIENRNFSVTAGDIGHRYLLRALADGGRSDVIFKLHSQTERPGYAYMLNQGATALTEAWDAQRQSSQNHFMLGHIMEWFYHDLGGIQMDPATPGFKNIVIRPQPVGDISWAKVSHESPYGTILSHWRRTGNTFTLDIEIPPNSTATVHLPNGSSQSCGSGKHSFSCKL